MTTRYHPVMVALHWLLALLIVVGLFMGGNVLAQIPNDDPAKLFSLRMHMGAGILILVLMVARLVVRVFTAKPPHADIGNALLNRGAVATHWIFYALVIGMGVSGMAMAKMAGLPEIVFGGSGDPLPASFYDLPPRIVHGIGATLLMVFIATHVVAALYHQFVRKDRLFARMWFGDRFR